MRKREAISQNPEDAIGEKIPAEMEGLVGKK
jgi:hypothetical protein